MLFSVEVTRVVFVRLATSIVNSDSDSDVLRVEYRVKQEDDVVVEQGEGADDQVRVDDEERGGPSDGDEVVAKRDFSVEEGGPGLS